MWTAVRRLRHHRRSAGGDRNPPENISPARESKRVSSPAAGSTGRGGASQQREGLQREGLQRKALHHSSRHWAQELAWRELAPAASFSQSVNISVSFLSSRNWPRTTEAWGDEDSWETTQNHTEPSRRGFVFSSSCTLSKPCCSSFFPRVSPIPDSAVTGLFPIGSPTKSRCFWVVVDMPTAANTEFQPVFLVSLSNHKKTKHKSSEEKNVLIMISGSAQPPPLGSLLPTESCSRLSLTAGVVQSQSRKEKNAINTVCHKDSRLHSSGGKTESKSRIPDLGSLKRTSNF